MNFYPFHIGDYASHTNHLTDAEDLAYRRMIDLYYMNEQPFNNCSTLARRVKSSVEVVQIILDEFFELQDDGCWHNKRIDEEIAKYQAIQNKKSQAGKASAAARTKSNTCSTSVEPTKNQEPISNNQIKTKSVTPPEGVDPHVWNDFVAHRKTKKAPISATALKGIQAEARKANISLQEALELCVMRGWTGFKAEWIEKQKSSSDKGREVLSGLTRGLMGGNNAGLLTI